MVKVSVVYEGDLHCRLTHGPSGASMATDAPKDNQGRGESFSPTDLVASALGSCMLTVMGIFAKRHLINLAGASAEVIKEMVQDPDRRVGKLTVMLQMPKGIDPAQRSPLEKTALTCPVFKSLNPAIEIPVQFNYPD